MKSKINPRFLFAASLISLGASVSATAAPYTWDGSTNTWSSIHWDNGVQLVAGPTADSDTATINSGRVNFSIFDTFGQSGITSSPIINLNGGTLASNGNFTTIWNLNLNGGTLLANGGAGPTYPAYQLGGTVTVGGSQVSTINGTSAPNSQINIGANTNANLNFNVEDATSNTDSDLLINATLRNNSAGVGSLTKSGAGKMTLTATNAYTGGTTVNQGTLALGNDYGNDQRNNALGTGPVKVTGGAQLRLGGVGGSRVDFFINNAITLDNGTIFSNDGYQRLFGGLTVAAGGGELFVQWGNKPFSIESPVSGPGTLTIANGPVLFTQGGTFGGLSGNGSANIPSGWTLTVGSNNTDTTFSGVIYNSGSLTKTGTGTLTLSGANTYTGATTVLGGALAVTGSSIANASRLVINGGSVDLSGEETVNTLFFGGVQQPAGTYSANGMELTGPGTLIVLMGAPNPYTTWANTFSPANVSSPTGDNDNDGLTNYQEFAFGLSPISGSSVNPMVEQLDIATGQFSYQRRAASGLTYKILTSTTLNTGSWTEDVTASQIVGTTDQNGNQTVVVTLTGALLAESTLFVRIAAELGN